MKKQAVNPYLPLFEYVPDGEPYVFGDRVYIYGSHDFAGGQMYCPGDYVAWSAPVEDLGNWRFEGVSYRATQDPANADGKLQLWAPDVVKGADGRYFLYYCLSFYPEISVAVSNHPAGPFEYYGSITYPAHINNGNVLREYMPFDPGVLVDDDGKVYLYYGFSPVKKLEVPDRETLVQMGVPEEDIARYETIANMEMSPGSMVVELESDMVTMKGEPKLCVPGGKIADGTGFEGHAFYEASSIRKVNDKYYFIYSSELSHELCYAVSDRPDSGFVYGGTIVSNGDVGYGGNQKPVNMMGNNHGSMVKIGEDWYIFYHRQTHRTESSRQGCAEKIEILPAGSIPQVEITSCGLNGGPLKAIGSYSAAIACRLTSPENVKKVEYGMGANAHLPYIYEEQIGASEQEHLHYIANVTNGVSFGFKYFAFEKTVQLSVTVRGEANGMLKLTLDDPDTNPSSEAEVLVNGDEWNRITFILPETTGVHAVFFTYEGEGVLQVKDILF